MFCCQEGRSRLLHTWLQRAPPQSVDLKAFSNIFGYLDECYRQYNEGVLDLVESVLNDLCHAKHRSPAHLMENAHGVYTWLTAKNIHPTCTIMVRCSVGVMLTE